MLTPPFTATQSAVDIVSTSPHPDNKVAACLFTDKLQVARTNEWPDSITKHIGHETRIGDSSGTLHAEVNCILHFSGKTDKASLSITDPCCPNCAKAIAESGIKKLYIDHKGFQKDFATRRGEEFKDMSLSIMAHAGIAIYKINRKEQTLAPIFEPDSSYIPPEDNPIEIKPGGSTDLQTLINSVHVKHERWGCALATDKDGSKFSLVASTHPAIGYSGDTPDTEGKYDFYLEPLSRLLFGAARHGLKLIDGQIWVSTLPTPRELVNFVGANLHKLAIGEMSSAKKDSSFAAQKILEENGIVEFKEQKR
ncbi:MAG TPA: deoxycytidylate deaminase [Alphaproteobacteria bacterium]|nr:deoxycytidylate deaminase [Alphaproteobacteria bacterium]HNS43948.1 deoxycytidylate deaminase [Alphaproteobacteria bacterium]